MMVMMMMMMMMTVMMVVTMMLMMMTIITMMIMMMMVMMLMMMMVVVVVVGKEEQKGKEKERQSLYTLTPDRPPLRPEYYHSANSINISFNTTGDCHDALIWLLSLISILFLSYLLLPILVNISNY